MFMNVFISIFFSTQTLWTYPHHFYDTLTKCNFYYCIVSENSKMITLTTIGITVLVNHCTLVIFEINKTILIVHITMSEIEHSAASELAVEVRILKLNISPDLTNLCLRWRLPDRNLVTAMAHWKSYRSKDIDLEEDTRDDLFITAGGPNYPEGRGKTFLDDVMKRISFGPV